MLGQTPMQLSLGLEQQFTIGSIAATEPYTVLSRNNLTLRLRFGRGFSAVRLRFGCGAYAVQLRFG